MDDLFPPAPEPPKSPTWLLVFTDMLSLLLTFFVLLFSMSSPKEEEWQKASQAFGQEFNKKQAVSTAESPGDFRALRVFRKSAIDLDYLAVLLQRQLNKDEMLKESAIHELSDRLVLSLPSDLLFAPGSAELTEESQTALFLLGGFLANIGNRLDVFGHTDPTPMSGKVFANNWELSVGRAATVAKSLQKAGYSKPLIAQGVADSKFSDISAAIPEGRRYALARRVDIVIYPTKAAAKPL